MELSVTSLIPPGTPSQTQDVCEHPAHAAQQNCIFSSFLVFSSLQKTVVCVYDLNTQFRLIPPGVKVTTSNVIVV